MMLNSKGSTSTGDTNQGGNIGEVANVESQSLAAQPHRPYDRRQEIAAAGRLGQEGRG